MRNIVSHGVYNGSGGMERGSFSPRHLAPFTERMEKAAKTIDLPDSLSVFTIVPFGYPAKKNPQQDRYDEARVHYVK